MCFAFLSEVMMEQKQRRCFYQCFSFCSGYSIKNIHTPSTNYILTILNPSYLYRTLLRTQVITTNFQVTSAAPKILTKTTQVNNYVHNYSWQKKILNKSNSERSFDIGYQIFSGTYENFFLNILLLFHDGVMLLIPLSDITH